MMATGSRITCMDLERTEMPMDRFTKASMKITRKMASFFFGVLMETSIKAVIRKTNAMVFTLYN